MQNEELEAKLSAIESRLTEVSRRLSVLDDESYKKKRREMYRESQLDESLETHNVTLTEHWDYMQRYTHEQTSASATWTITHNLGRHPAVEVVNSGGTIVYGLVTHDSEDQVTVEFTGAISGKAYLI